MANELTLRIQHDDEVTLPSAILDGPLSLAEIGALVMVAAVAEGQASLDHPRMATDEVVAAMNKLRERGIFTATVEGKKLKLDFNLDPAIPE